MSYKKDQRFSDSGDLPDFRIERDETRDMDVTAIAYEAGKTAFESGTKRDDNPETDILLRRHWANGWDVAQILSEIT